jgi:DNA-binding GntR family transcriptional regulator
MGVVRQLRARKPAAEGAVGAKLTVLQTKGDYAYRLVRDQIITGDLPAGAIVQQRELAARLGISTTPLREALRRLDGEGLIELDAHRNARVTELRAEEARDLLELRRSLDPMAAALAAERRSTSDLREIQAALRDLAPLPVEATLEQLLAHRRFHRAIYRASHNELLIETLDGLWDKADRYRMLALQVDRGQEARDIKAREHEQLAQFIAAGDADSTRAVMLAHIDTSLAVTAAHRLSAELS